MLGVIARYFGTTAGVVLLLALFCGSAYAQIPDPCTIAGGGTVVLKVSEMPIGVGFRAWAPVDGYQVLVNGTAIPSPGPLVALTPPPFCADGLTAYATPVAITLPVGVSTVTVRTLDASGTPSVPSVPVTVTVVAVQPPVDPCLSDSPSVFVTRFLMSSTGRPGSQMAVLYQASSPKTPVTQIVVSVDGVEVRRSPAGNVDVSPFGLMWFTTPASGTHALSVVATNAAACSTEAASPLALRVK